VVIVSGMLALALPFAVTAMTASPVLGGWAVPCSSARSPVAAEGNLTNFY
jgi:hypothetical protein